MRDYKFGFSLNLASSLGRERVTPVVGEEPKFIRISICTSIKMAPLIRLTSNQILKELEEFKQLLK